MACMHACCFITLNHELVLVCVCVFVYFVRAYECLYHPITVTTPMFGSVGGSDSNYSILRGRESSPLN